MTFKTTIGLASAATLLVTLLVFWAVTWPEPFPTTTLLPHKPSDWYGMLGQIGDFYGGVFGTIAAVAGLYYVYHSFRQQQQEAAFALVNQLYSDLLANIASIQYRSPSHPFSRSSPGTLYEGVDALYHYQPGETENKNSVLNHVNLIVSSFNQLAQKIEDTTFTDTDAKKLMLDKAYLMAYAKIIWPVYQGIYEPYRDQLLVADWGNVDAAFYHFENLIRHTFTYLRDEKLIRPAGTGTAHELEAIVAAKELPWEDWLAHTNTRLADQRRQFEAEEAARRKTRKPEHTPNIRSLRDWLSPTARIILDWLPVPPSFKQPIITAAGKVWALDNSHLPPAE